jgi:thiol-disulfide isomerase/thioredoxin
VNEERKTELQKRMEHVREMAVGKTAPDIIIKNSDGSQLQLADIDSDYTLILFWASWCPHCGDMIPAVEQMYLSADLPDFEVLAISIDTSAAAYSSALAEHGTPWINYSELKGWNSKAAVDYSIYATPSMFLIDRNRKIIARPVTAAELNAALISIGNN